MTTAETLVLNKIKTSGDKFWVLLLAAYRLLGWRQNVDDARMVPFRNNGIFIWADGIALTQDSTPPPVLL